MIKTISTSRRNFYDYKIFEKFVAGMVLTGNEIKAMRSGSISIVGSYLTNNGTDFFINEISIPPYKKSHPVDSRKKKKIRLLLKKREMFKLSSELKSKNLFLIPLRIFINEKG
jgi:SsrA-binding protein